MGTNERLVVLESMPAQYRDSHRAARNWGSYPANGAQRFVLPRVDAEEIVESDSDGYDRIVRDAKPGEIDDGSRPDGW